MDRALILWSFSAGFYHLFHIFCQSFFLIRCSLWIVLGNLRMTNKFTNLLCLMYLWFFWRFLLRDILKMLLTLMFLKLLLKIVLIMLIFFVILIDIGLLRLFWFMLLRLVILRKYVFKGFLIVLLYKVMLWIERFFLFFIILFFSLKFMANTQDGVMLPFVLFLGILPVSVLLKILIISILFLNFLHLLWWLFRRFFKILIIFFLSLLSFFAFFSLFRIFQSFLNQCHKQLNNIKNALLMSTNNVCTLYLKKILFDDLFLGH